MAYRINIKGIDITASTAAEAAALVRELTEQYAPKVGRPRLIERPDAGAGINGKEIALAFLTTIANAGPRGAEAEELMKVLRVSHPKGVGGRSVRIINILSKLGFAQIDVYDNTRTAEGRFWKPRAKLHEAIAALKGR